MRFLRVYAQQGLHSCWLEQQPPLARLLKCFDVKRDAIRPPEPASVYRVNDAIEELEVVAALTQTAPSRPEKRFGVLVSQQDCQAAGIRIDRREPGQTGVADVDARHANLIGEREQFFQLIVGIVAGLWIGEHRLRVYPTQAILGQLTVFSLQSDAAIHPDTRANCERMLSFTAERPLVVGSPPRIQVRGTLQDGERPLTVLAERRPRAAVPWWVQLWRRIVSGTER